jgi:hypothetical protein
VPLVNVFLDESAPPDDVHALVAALKDGVAAAMARFGVEPKHVVVACSSSPYNDLGGFDALASVEPDYKDERVDTEDEIAEALEVALKADPRVRLKCDIRVALTFCRWVTIGTPEVVPV